MSKFCAHDCPLWGSIRVFDFCYSATARARRLDNRLPVALLSNSLKVGHLVTQCEKLVGAPFNLLQGYRSAELNRAIGGGVKSYHMQGLAVDGLFVGVGMLEAGRILAASDLPIVEIELKQTMLHIAYGPREARKLFRQYVSRGPVVPVEFFPVDGVRG